MCISFNYEKNIFFILLFILISILFYYTNKFVNDKLGDLYTSISKISLLIFYLIEKKLNKNESNQFFNFKININQIFKEYLIIFCSIVFYSTFFYSKIFKSQDLVWIKHTQMCFFLLIDIIFFKNERYSHQIFSIVFIMILSIIIFIISFQKFDFIFFFYISNSYSYAFSLLLVKYINTKYFISVYIFGFIFGLIELILLLIKGFFQFNLNWIDILFYFELIGNYYLFYYIIYKLTPTHSIISQCFSILLPTKLSKFDLNLNILLILSIIIIISGLIYLEIIELNFCNLNLNLKKNIDNRGKNEDITILFNDDLN